MIDRTEQLLRGLNKDMLGIEIGPFFNPLAPKSNGWKTTIVDFTDKVGLTRRVEELGQPDVTANIHRIEEVDFIWRDTPLHELVHGKFDFFLASHVIEHIPDLIRFFQSLDKIMSPNGVISLAVPDLRYCFDFYKAPTSTAKVLLAYRLKPRHHLPETIFETDTCDALVENRGAWLREPFIIPRISRDLLSGYENYLAYIEAETNNTQIYRDVHCWQFTPKCFEIVVFELNCLDLISFDVDWIEENPGSEFIVQMKRHTNRLDRQSIHEKRIGLYRAAAGELANRAPY